VNPIYDELADRRGVDVPDNPITWEPATMTTGALEQTVSGQAPGVQYAGYSYYPVAAPSDIPPSGAGMDDALVQRTWNGLRPDDLALPQPPQDPYWRPDGDR